MSTFPSCVWVKNLMLKCQCLEKLIFAEGTLKLQSLLVDLRVTGT